MCLECEKLKKQQLLSDKRTNREIERFKQIISAQEVTISKLRKEVEKKNLQLVTFIINATKEKKK